MQNNQIQQNKAKRNRPKNLNLLTIRLPINALVSILHRATGCLLFLILPLLLIMLQLTLRSAEHYQMAKSLMNTPFTKIMLLGLAWAFFHHFFAGIRHLAMDVHWMTTLMKARSTSKAVLALGVLATIALAIRLLAW
jgi:succinate dehydrogenase / fumarate reductase cytochrome b subunit